MVTGAAAVLVRRLRGNAVMPEWYDRAICAQTDPEAFYPEKGGSTAAAKRICEICPVRTDCLIYALAKREQFGIWGGTSERERQKLRKSAAATQEGVAA